MNHRIMDPARARRIRRRIKMALRRGGLRMGPDHDYHGGMGQFSFPAIGGAGAGGFGSILGGVANVGVGIWDKIESGKLQKETIKANRDIEIARANAEASKAAAFAASGRQPPRPGINPLLIAGGVGALGLVLFLALKK